MDWVHVMTPLDAVRRAARVAGVLGVLAGGAAVAAEAPGFEALGYTVEVSDVTAKVGEPTMLRAKLHPRPGARILHAYNNRVGQLSSFDDGVAFDRKSFVGTDEDGTLVFVIALRATKPGEHPINGVFRVGYMEGTDSMSMVSVPLMAKVVGAN